jgi:hypothetical protein
MKSGCGLNGALYKAQTGLVPKKKVDIGTYAYTGEQRTASTHQ